MWKLSFILNSLKKLGVATKGDMLPFAALRYVRTWAELGIIEMEKLKNVALEFVAWYLVGLFYVLLKW